MFKRKYSDDNIDIKSPKEETYEEQIILGESDEEVIIPFKIPKVKEDYKILRFSGTDLNIVLGIISIYKKYKDKICFPFKKVIQDESIAIEWYCINDERRISYPRNFWKNILLCNKKINNKFQYIGVPLFLAHKDRCTVLEGNHMNILIYNPNQKIVFRFEPNGLYTKMDGDLLDEELAKEFNEHGISYRGMIDTCPYQKIQTRTFKYSKLSKYEKTDPGFCAAWSLWFLEIVLSNFDNNLTIEDIENFAYKTLKINEFTDYIFGYGEFIYDMRYYLLRQIKKREIYKLLFTIQSSIEYALKQDGIKTKIHLIRNRIKKSININIKDETLNELIKYIFNKIRNGKYLNQNDIEINIEDLNQYENISTNFIKTFIIDDTINNLLNFN